jgi:hypothetical protein
VKKKTAAKKSDAAKTEPEQPQAKRPLFARLLDENEPFWRLVLPIVVLRLSVYFFTFMWFRMVQGGAPGFWNTFEKLWFRWDVEHYVQIAENGYVTTGNLAKNMAFFPLFPTLTAVLHGILRFIPTVFAGMLISNVASLAGLWYLHRLALKRWDARIADMVVIYVATFPTAYFFLAAYTEGLFFLFVVGAFYYLDEEKWFEAALWAAFASATRITGCLIGVCWLVKWVQKKGWKPSLQMWPIVIAPLGFAAYLIINQVVWGDPLKFLEFQRTEWHHVSEAPWSGFADCAEYLFSPQRQLMKDWWFRDIPEFGAAILGYVAAVLVFWKIGLAEGIYVLGSVLLWTSNNWWMSGLRFCLVLFPMFLYAASRKWPRPVHQSIWAFGVVAQMTFAIVFSLGNWAF